MGETQGRSCSLQLRCNEQEPSLRFTHISTRFLQLKDRGRLKGKARRRLWLFNSKFNSKHTALKYKGRRVCFFQLREEKMQENNMDELRERFIKMCPDVITTISDMIGNPETPGSVKVQLIAIVLDRALGKPETPVKVTANAESFEEAEIELMAMVRQIQIEHGMVQELPEKGG